MSRARMTSVARTLIELWERARRSGVFRRTALPMASYYAVTLALPLANGAAQSDAFVEHALVVLIVPPVAIMLACAIYTVAHAVAGTCCAVRSWSELAAPKHRSPSSAKVLRAAVRWRAPMASRRTRLRTAR